MNGKMKLTSRTFERKWVDADVNDQLEATINQVRRQRRRPCESLAATPRVTLGNGAPVGVGGGGGAPPAPPPPQGCIRREEAIEAVGQAVGGGCQSGWGRLLSRPSPSPDCGRGTSFPHDPWRIAVSATNFPRVFRGVVAADPPGGAWGGRGGYLWR